MLTMQSSETQAIVADATSRLREQETALAASLQRYALAAQRGDTQGMRMAHGLIEEFLEVAGLYQSILVEHGAPSTRGEDDQ